MWVISVSRPLLTSVAMEEEFSAVLRMTERILLSREFAEKSRKTSGAGEWGAERECR